MKKNNTWALLAIGAGALLAGKIRQRKAAFQSLADEFDIKEKSPLGILSKVRDMNDDDFSKFKEAVKEKFPRVAGCRKCCQ